MYTPQRPPKPLLSSTLLLTLLLPSLMTGCGDGVRVDLPDAGTDAGGPRDSGPPNDAGHHVDGGADAGDADAGTEDLGMDDGGATEPPNACFTDSPSAFACDFVAADATHRWIRRTPSAVTFTVVPARPEAESVLPVVYRIHEVNPSHFIAQDTDGGFARIDWLGSLADLRICLRTASDLAGVQALGAPSSDANAGCAGGAWTALTEVTP